MPNGRTGGFYLEPSELERLLSRLAGDVVVGKTLREPVTASAMMQRLGKLERDRIPIEEQDNSWYIVHFPEWITVDEKSTLFMGLRLAHADFLEHGATEHENGGETA